MTISLENAGKQFGRDWIFRKINYTFHSGNSYAILGPNGSGKSTLLQILAFYKTPTEGKIFFSQEDKIIPADDVFRSISLCAPYMQLIEEFTLEEQLKFHFNFKKTAENLNSKEIISISGLQKHAQKEIRYFSSGMKQRVKLCLSLLTDVPVILLDEPATNLDEQGVQWYQELLKNFLNDRLLIISSNRKEEFEMCEEKLFLENYK